MTDSPGRFAKILNRLSHLKGPIVAIAGVGAVLSGLLGWYTSYKTVAGGPVATTTAATPANAALLSILVLPFANQTGDPNKAYIADALTSSISADLNRIRDAFVVPTASAFAYKDKAMTVQQVGKDAAVRFVVQGGVVASGDTLRINVQLADTQSGKQLWNETFEGNATNIFELQDLVTTRIGNSIGTEMVIVAAQESEKRSRTPKVTDLLLRVRALETKPQSLANLMQSEAWLREALKNEPDNAQVLAMLASTLTSHATNFIGEDSEAVFFAMVKEAQTLALRAQAIDDTLPGIYIALGVHAANVLNDRQAWRRINERWVALDPKNPNAYIRLSVTYVYAGEPQKGVELLNKALSLYPKGHTSLFVHLSRAYLMLGDNAAAIDWGQKAIDGGDKNLDTPSYLAMAYSNLGQPDKARQHADDYKRRMKEAGVSNIAPTLDGTEPAAYAKYLNERYLPEWKKAGLL